MPEAEIRRRFTGTLHQRTPHSIGDVEELVRDSKRTRARGYAMDDEESRVGLVCLGCPVLDASGNALGGVAVALEKLRWKTLDQKAIRLAIMEFARLMSRQLGHADSARVSLDVRPRPAAAAS
jgi:DNA-binding IclR family transcriptional regulator